MAYSPDGKFLAAGGQQRVIRLLDTTTGKPVGDLPERPGEVLALCFCGPNLLASAGSGNVIHLWDVAARQERCRLVGHTGSITTLAFHRDGATLISGSYDTTVRLWDVKNADREKVTRRATRAGQLRRAKGTKGSLTKSARVVLRSGGSRAGLRRRFFASLGMTAAVAAGPRTTKDIDREVDVGLFHKAHPKHVVPQPHRQAPRSARSRSRVCRFEQMEPRQLLSVTAPALNVGATYYQPHDGNDSVGSLLYISWNGGAANTLIDRPLYRHPQGQRHDARF